ncbi:MAG: hypothetical protein ABSG03_24300 [Bryobacteraceae bacterium]|jgi:hypothetical protein
MTKSILTLSVLALVGMPFAAQASFITGVLNITGTANISLGAVSFVGNDFLINSPASSQQGGFMALEDTTGTIDNISNPPEVTTPPGSFPAVTDFMTFTAAPNITFTFTVLLAGIDGVAGCTDAVPAANQLCTPDLPDQSPFNLQNTSTSTSTASFTIDGVEVDSTNPGVTAAVVGTFTTPFTNMNFQQLLSDVEAGDTITTPFSAQFAVTAPTTTPEPSSLFELMMGIGLVGVSLVYRKKKLNRA